MEIHGKDHYRQNRFSAFWDRMALHYPLPFEERTLSDTRKVLSLVRNKGVKFHKASILDIGCGTGIYTLPLALEAATVTGIDDSKAMIERMTDVIQRKSIKNVCPLKSAWKEIDISTNDFEKAFDIVWVSMSPAVQTEHDFKRMENCARKWCVYIGWGRKRKNVLMEEIFRLHGIHYGPPPGAEAAYDILVRMGRNPSLDYFETDWDWTGKVENALEDMVCFIEMQGGRANRDLIRKALGRHEQEGIICHTTHVEEGVMVWPVE